MSNESIQQFYQPEANDGMPNNEQPTQEARESVPQKLVSRRNFLKLAGLGAGVATIAALAPRGVGAASPTVPSTEGEIEGRKFKLEQSFAQPVGNSITKFYNTFIQRTGFKPSDQEYDFTTSSGGYAARYKYLDQFVSPTYQDPTLINPEHIAVAFGEQTQYDSDVLNKVNEKAPQIISDGLGQSEVTNAQQWGGLAIGLVELLGKNCDPARVSKVKIIGSQSQNTDNINAASAEATTSAVTSGEISIWATNELSKENKDILLSRVINEMRSQNKRVKVGDKGHTACLGLSLEQWGQHVAEGMDAFTENIDWLMNEKFHDDSMWKNIANQYGGGMGPTGVEDAYVDLTNRMVFELLTVDDENFDQTLEQYNAHPKLKEHLLKEMNYMLNSYKSTGTEISLDELTALRKDIHTLYEKANQQETYTTYLPSVQNNQ